MRKSGVRSVNRQPTVIHMECLSVNFQQAGIFRHGVLIHNMPLYLPTCIQYTPLLEAPTQCMLSVGSIQVPYRIGTRYKLPQSMCSLRLVHCPTCKTHRVPEPPHRMYLLVQMTARRRRFIDRCYMWFMGKIRCTEVKKRYSVERCSPYSPVLSKFVSGLPSRRYNMNAIVPNCS
jgi:hypothetical protein